VAKRIVHDLFDRARTPAALGAAAKTAINFATAARSTLFDGGTHVMIRNHITGTDDHLGSGG
jgi:hypothetical protein